MPTTEKSSRYGFSYTRQRTAHYRRHTMLDKLVKEHIILGVDPGTLYMGYALLHTTGSKVEIIDFGVFDVHKFDKHRSHFQL